MSRFDDRSSGPTWRAARWLFADRATGHIVIAQWPNLPLWIYIAAIATGAILKPHGTRVLGIVAAVALGLWALDEIARGVNPWRRLLGTAVLIWLVVSHLR